VWGLNEAWQENNEVCVRFCKQIIRIPRFAANGVEKVELETGVRYCALW
jgi:hypothetical protein